MPRRAPSIAILFAVLGALATEAAFPSRSWWPLAPVGLALLLLALRGVRLPAAFGLGLVWGLVFFLPHLFWADAAAGGVPWLLLAFSQALVIALFAMLQVVLERWPALQVRPWLAVLASAALWVSLEQVRSLVPFGGLPWGLLAFSQTTGPLLRLATLGGTVLVSGVVVILAHLLVQLVIALRRGSVWRAGLAVCIGAVLVAAGVVVAVDTRAEAGHLRVAAVQGNVPGTGLDAFAVRRDVVARHAAGTTALSQQYEPGEIDVVLWPENAADIDPRADPATAELVDDAARAVGAPILVGAIRRDDEHRYNDAVLWVPGQGDVATYTKQHLAPFGEYVPLRSLARKVTEAVDLVSVDMLPGTEPGIVPMDSERLDRVVEIGVGICFEVAYNGIVREAVVEGGELLVIPTNNASFGYTQESNQQLAMSVFRAVEHARATVHISTVGTSAIIAPDGVITDSGGHFTAEQLVATVPLRTSLTIATRLGAWPGIVAGALAGITVIGAIIGSRRSRVEAAGA